MKDSTKKLIGLATRLRWLDKSYRRKVISSMKDVCSKPSIKRNRIRAINKRWSVKGSSRLHSKIIKNTWNDPIIRKKRIDGLDKAKHGMSKRKLASYAQGKSSPTISRNGRLIQSSKAGLIICHGIWEVLCTDKLDKAETVLHFGKDIVRIPYRDGRGKLRTYFPDFKISTSTQVIVLELKSGWLDTNDKLQIESAKKFCAKSDWRYIVLLINNYFDFCTDIDNILKVI